MRYVLVLVAACGAATPHNGGAPTAGSIAGLARDHDSGDPVAKANIHVRAVGNMAPLTTISSADGIFGIDHLAPGMYTLTADFAGQAIDIENIAVQRGAPTVVDVMFTLGRPDPVHVDFGDPREGAIDRFHPKHHPLALIEGTVNDPSTHTRIAGAVITAIGPGSGPSAPTLQAVSDDMGRYRFDPVPPGMYVVSAYYSIGGRGQFEMRRSQIEVGAAEGVTVPLWVEVVK